VPEAKVLEAAVAKENGVRQLWLGTSSSHSIYHKERKTASVEVRTFSLPYLLKEYRPRVLKVDVEGAEYEIDWSHSLAPVEELAVEFHLWRRGNCAEKAVVIAALLEEQGFNVITPMRTGGSIYTVGVWSKVRSNEIGTKPKRRRPLRGEFPKESPKRELRIPLHWSVPSFHFSPREVWLGFRYDRERRELHVGMLFTVATWRLKR